MKINFDTDVVKGSIKQYVADRKAKKAERRDHKNTLKTEMKFCEGVSNMVDAKIQLGTPRNEAIAEGLRTMANYYEQSSLVK